MVQRNATQADGEVPKPPSGLGARGRSFFKQIAADYRLAADGIEVLVELCRVLDRLEALDGVLRRDGVTSTGSKGQPVAHPALGEARQQAALLDRLVRTLGIPAPGGEEQPSAATVQAARAATSRKLRRDEIEARRQAWQR